MFHMNQKIEISILKNTFIIFNISLLQDQGLIYTYILYNNHLSLHYFGWYLLLILSRLVSKKFDCDYDERKKNERI